MKIFIKTKKFISIITTLCLLISFVIGPTAANAMTNEEATAKYKQIFKDFMLPYNYGQITSSHYAGTDRVIINIQDLHCHPKVQKNISNIIEIFDKSFGVKNVYLEGVYGQLSTKWVSDRIEPAKKGEILEKMLDTGRLTGAEYYSLMSGKTEIITGLEEKIPYLENLKRFGEIVESQEKINLILNAISESLAEVKKQYYTKRQYKLEELSKNYREGTITPQKYYALLSKHIDKLGIDLSKYENTFTYISLLEMQKTLDYSKITNELQNLILLLRENLANSAYQMLVDNTENFSKIDKLYGYIVRISRELGLDLTVNFPNLDNYFGYIEFSQKINPLELIDEEKRLTEEINTRFSETKAQMEVVFLTNFERYLRDYVSSKITADDYEYYKENIDTFRQLWNKYVDNKVLSMLEEYIAEADKFYKINTDRNIYFTDNMFTENNVLGKLENEVEAKGEVNKIIDNMKGVKEVDIVITGGFHSQTVTEILKNQGVSYIVITPNVTDGVKLAEDTYYEIAKEQSKISFQALATLPFCAYRKDISEDVIVKAAVTAFGVDIAKELFPTKVAQIDTITLSEEEKETARTIAEQMKIIKRKIQENKFLESDDDNFVEFLKNISGEDVSLELAQNIDLEELKEILENGQVGYIKNVLRNAEKDMHSNDVSKAVRKATKKIRRTFIRTINKFVPKKGIGKKQEGISTEEAEIPKEQAAQEEPVEADTQSVEKEAGEIEQQTEQHQQGSTVSSAEEAETPKEQAAQEEPVEADTQSVEKEAGEIEQQTEQHQQRSSVSPAEEPAPKGQAAKVQPTKKTSVEQSREKVIKDIIEEYGKFTQFDSEPITREAVFKYLEDKSLDLLEKYLDLLKSLDKNYESINGLHTRYVGLFMYTADDSLIKDFILGKIDMLEFFRRASKTSLNLRDNEDKKIIIELPSGAKYSIEIENYEKYDEDNFYLAKFIVTELASDIGFEMSLRELKEKLSIFLEFHEGEIFVFYDDSIPAEKQEIIESIESIGGKLSEEARKQLSKLKTDYLKSYLDIIKNLAETGKDININDIHNDLYYFIKEEMLPSIIISIFEPYYRGKITYNNLKTNIDKAKILMKYFRTNASEKLNSRNMWFYDSTFNLLEKNKRLVNRIYKIGKALDEFIEKENIDTEIDDMKGRDIGHLLQNAFEAGRSNQYIIKIIEEFLSGKITYYEAYERMERLKITKKIEGLRGKLKKQYIKLRLSGYKYRDVFLDEISDMESFDWQNRKKLLKKLLSSTRNLSEEEVRYLAQNTSVLLSASDYYNTELSSTVRSIGKINGNILKLLKEKNFEAEGPASAMLLLELLSTDLEVNESNYEQLEDLMIDLSNNLIYHFALESDALPLKVFFSSAFQNQYKDLPVLIQYRSAIKISRFMEVTETASIFTKQNSEGQDEIIKEAIYTLSEILKKAGEKTFLDENTKVLMVNHNERNEDGSYRFTSQAFRNIMENLFMPNPENLSEEEIDKILKKIDGMMNVYGESDKEGFSTSRNRIFNFFERINKFGIPISITAPILVVLSNTVPVLGFLLSPALVILFVVLFQIVVTLIDKGELVEAQKMFANISIKNGFNQRKQVGRLFKAISDFRYKEGKTENLLAILNGHGSAGLWFYSDMGFVRVAPRFARSIEKLIKDMEQEKWTEKDIEETVDRMKQENKTEKEIEEEVNNIRKKINDGSRRWTDEDIKNTVEHITIDLSCCYSYRTAEIVKKEFAKRKIKYCPQIVSEAGKEMVLGYGGSEGGNLERAIYSYIKEDHPEVREHRRISLKDIFYSEIINSNHTIFMMDDSVKGLFDDFIGKVKKIESSSEQSQQDVPEVSQERKRSLSSATIIPSNLAEKFAKILENRRLGGESRESYYAELQSEPTKKRLEEYAERQKAKGKKDKAYENPEKFRFTAKGKLLGVWYEMLDLWKIFSIHTAIFGKEINVNSFVEEHENPTAAQIIAIWVIRALSIGFGITAGKAAITALMAASIPMVVTPIIAVFAGVVAASLTEFITHLIWNFLPEQLKQKQDETPATQQEQKGKKGIRNILKGVFLVLIVSLSLVGFSLTAHAAEQTPLSAQESSIVAVHEDESSSIEQVSISNKDEQTPELSFEYLINSVDSSYVSQTLEDFNRSIAFSERSDVLQSVQTLKSLLNKKLGLSISNDTKIVFMVGTKVGGSNHACAFVDINTIVICVDELSTDSIDSLITLLSGNMSKDFDLKSALYLLIQLAHEASHGSTNVPLEDEALAIRSEITVVDKLMQAGILDMEMLKSKDFDPIRPDMYLKFSDGKIAHVNRVNAMKYIVLKNAEANVETIANQFGNTSIYDINYVGNQYSLAFSENGIGLTSIPKDSGVDLKSTEVLLFLADKEGNLLGFIVDTGIDVGGVKKDFVYTEKIEYNKDSKDFVTSPESINKIIDLLLAQETTAVSVQEEQAPETMVGEKEAEQVEKAEQKREIPIKEVEEGNIVETQENRLPIIAFLGALSALIIGFVSKIMSSKLFSSKKTKATALFKGDEDGNIYIIVDKGKGQQYLLTFNHKYNRIYVSSVNNEETNDFFSKDTSQYTSIEDIEKFLGLKINISSHSITVKSTDSIADIQIVKQENISDTVSKLKGTAVVKQDEEVLGFLKGKLNITDNKDVKNVETVFMDEPDGQIEKKIEGLMSEGEGDKLLVIYPSSQVYNTTDIKQLFSVYFNFAKNLRDIFGLTWFPSFKSKDKEFANEVQTFGTLILLEFVKNAIVHGNLADLSKPIYIKYGKDKYGKYGFTVYNVYHKKTKESKTTEEKLRFVLSTMVGLTGAHEGLSHIRKAETDGIVSNLYQEDTAIEGMEDTYLYSISVSQSDDIVDRLKERRKRQLESRNVVRTISVKDLLEKHTGNCVLHVEQSDGSIATILFAAMSEEESPHISVLYQMLPDGTVVDMKGKNLTLDEINSQFNINITIDTNKDTGERYITVKNKERNGAKSISPFVSFANAKEIVDEIKRSDLPENALSLEDLIKKLKRLGELKGEKASEEKEKLEQELKQKTLVVYPYYLGYDVTELTSEQIDALYIYISNLLNSITLELLNGDNQLAHCLKETLKNAFLHGNLLNPNTPIYIQFNESLNHFDVYNKVEKRADYLKSQKKYRKMSYFATRTNLFGGTHQFYSTYLQGQYKDILDSTIGEEDINKEKYYKVSIGRKGTEAPKEVEQQQTTPQVETKPETQQQETAPQIEQAQQQQETQPVQQEFSPDQKTEIVRETIEKFLEGREGMRVELPVEIEQEIIPEIIKQYDSRSRTIISWKEDLLDWFENENNGRNFALLAQAINFLSKQDSLKEHLVRLEWLKVLSDKNEEDRKEKERIFRETIKMLKYLESLKTDLNGMNNAAKELNVDSEVYDLVNFLVSKECKSYELEQILKNLGLMERSDIDIADDIGGANIQKEIQQKMQEARGVEIRSIVDFAAKMGINPTELVNLTVDELIREFFGAATYMKDKNIIVDDDVDISELKPLAEAAGINIIKLRIITESEDQQRGGLLINEQNKIRMSFDPNSNELLVYSKQGISLSPEAVKKLIEIAYNEGRKDLKFADEQVIAFAKKGEISSDSKKIDQSLANIQDRITNAAINGVQRAELEVSLDLSGIENIGDLEKRCQGMSPTAIIINKTQLEILDISQMEALREKGFRFILRGTISELEDVFEKRGVFTNSKFNLDGAILEGAKKGNLNQLEELAANNTEGTLHIETQMYIDMATAQGIDANRIYDDNGIIPIITADQAKEMTGKYAVGYNETMTDKEIKDMLSSGKLVNIVCAEGKESLFKKLRQKLAGIFNDMFGTMNELLKPKSPEQRISEETNAVSNYNFGEEFENMKSLKDAVVGDLRTGGIIKRILTEQNVTDEKTAENLVIEFKRSPIYQQLPSVMRMRIQTEMEEWKYFETIGTIRGFVNQVIDQTILSQLEGVERKDYFGKKQREYRQYARTIILQLLMSNEKLDLDSLVKLRPDTNQRVEDLFNEIKTNLNKGVIKSIIENKTAIKEISDNDEENAIANLRNINALLEDSLIKAREVKQLEISAQKVRSILAAA